MSTIVYETKYFKVFTPLMPHITRSDGGHLVIDPKRRILDRTEMSQEEAIDCVRLTMAVGEALSSVLNKKGIDIGRINYQDNSNWSVNNPEGPHFHIHVYGRAKSGVTQKWGEALNFPHPRTGAYEHVEHLTEDDVKDLTFEISEIFKIEKFQDNNWHL